MMSLRLPHNKGGVLKGGFIVIITTDASAFVCFNIVKFEKEKSAVAITKYEHGFFEDWRKRS